jgi:conserved oligomeric Golgi complex subunit 6
MAQVQGLSIEMPLRDTMSIGPKPPQTPGNQKGVAPLTSKVTAILSSSYSDTEFRDALALLDERGAKNDPETRRRIRLDLQKEVIDSNGEIIGEFGRVAEVSDQSSHMSRRLTPNSNLSGSGRPCRS